MYIKYMATLFSSNSNSYYRSLHQYKANSAAGSQEQVDSNRYQLLYSNALNGLKTDITHFGENKFDKLINFDSSYNQYLTLLNASSLNADRYNTPDIQKLTNYTYDSRMFINYRDLFVEVLRGLQNGINLNTTNTNLNTTIASLIADNNSLKTLQLANYIDTQPNMTNIYTNATFTDILSTELLPWYSEYLYLYGPPKGGFDSKLLASIIDTQIRKGLYTLEYFLAADKTVIN